MKLTSLKRKKYQRYINKIVRKLNQNIKNDWVWNGRFTIRQKQSKFYTYYDNSGAQLYVLLECKDNKINRTATCWFETGLFVEAKIWEWVNRCIVEYFDVWAEDLNPFDQAKLEGRYAELDIRRLAKHEIYIC